jgi:hypothetical protein
MDEDKENIELYLTKGGKQIGKRARNRREKRKRWNQKGGKKRGKGGCGKK